MATKKTVGKARAEKTTKNNSSQKRGDEKNFKLSEKALELVEQVKNDRGNMSNFVSKCIEEYGPALLNEGLNLSLAKRMEYLEVVTVDMHYNQISAGWSKATRKAYQDILTNVSVKQWYNKNSIGKLQKEAEGYLKAKDTTFAEWQTLLRCKDKILEDS